MSFFNLIPSKASTQLNSTFFFFIIILTPNSLNHSSWSVPRYNYPEQTRNDLLFFTNLWCYLSFILHLKASSILSFSSLGGLCKCVCERDCVCVCVCVSSSREAAADDNLSEGSMSWLSRRSSRGWCWLTAGVTIAFHHRPLWWLSFRSVREDVCLSVCLHVSELCFLSNRCITLFVCEFDLLWQKSRVGSKRKTPRKKCFPC